VQTVVLLQSTVGHLPDFESNDQWQN
jgi:hypothetical protein